MYGKISKSVQGSYKVKLFLCSLIKSYKLHIIDKQLITKIKKRLKNRKRLIKSVLQAGGHRFEPCISHESPT